MGLDPVTSAISGVGSIVSGIGGKNAQKAAQAAANQATGAENKALGTEETGISSLLNQFFGSGGGQQGMNSLMQYLQGQTGQTYSSPYTTGAANTASQLGSTSNPNAQGTVANQLANFNGLKQPELNALQTTLGNSGNSTVKTLMSQLGSTGNPNALAQSLLNSNNENALNSTVQLGSLASQQQLGALESAGNLQQQGLQSQGSLLSNLSGQNLTYGQDNTQNQLSLYGQEAGLATGGLSGLQDIAGIYGNAASGAAKTAASYGNPWANTLTGLAGSGIFDGLGSSSGSSGVNYGSGGYSPAGAANMLGALGPNYGYPTQPGS
jgi:hypothetical protein